jgi:DNA-binding transcriptional ArsR family regulator
MGPSDSLTGRRSVLGHPTRRAIVLTLASENRELSPTGLARLHGVKRTRALYYHFGYLARHGLVELVRTEVHSTVEHFYGLTARGRAAACRLRSEPG